jgi:methionyl-tRNA formyltransferase
MVQKNTVLFGTPQFTADILKHILTCQTCQSNLKIVGVVTQSDQPQNRNQFLSPSPVAKIASLHHLPTFKPEKLDSENLSHLKLLKPEIFLVIAYGQIIPKNYLDTPTEGTFNIHYSLLPKYRGALCLSEAIKNQERETGVTLMLMDEQLDHGPIIDQKSIFISPTDDVFSLQTKLEPATLNLLHTSLPDCLNHKIIPTPQDNSKATYTPKTSTRTRQTAFITWETVKNAVNGHHFQKTCALIRSNNPEPGSWTKINNQEIKILQVTTNQDKLEILSVQLPGKKPISWQQFISGHPQT